jgi:hypothetical protein
MRANRNINLPSLWRLTTAPGLVSPPLEKPRPKSATRPELASNCVQNSGYNGESSDREASKANCINGVYGVGDGNRGHIPSLGKITFVRTTG